ncbi:MAG: hypothetical protein KBG12_09235 [Syntrophobacterales bacterium]|nr:hypothetical protein [Syntrophobacterales bacterium]
MTSCSIAGIGTVVKPLAADALVTEGKNPAVQLEARKSFAVAVKSGRTETRLIVLQDRPAGML